MREIDTNYSDLREIFGKRERTNLKERQAYREITNLIYLVSKMWYFHVHILNKERIYKLYLCTKFCFTYIYTHIYCLTAKKEYKLKILLTPSIFLFPACRERTN